MGKEMQNGKQEGKNWAISKDIREFHKLLYGDSKFRTQGNNKQAKICDAPTKQKKRTDNEICTTSSKRKKCNDTDNEVCFV